MDIFWIEKKQRCGPLPVVEIVSMLERGDLTSEMKSWHQGCEHWLPMKELPALDYYFKKLQQQAREREDDASVTEVSNLSNSSDSLALDADEIVPPPVNKVRVFVAPPLSLRFWARFFDLFLYSILYFGVARLYGMAFTPALFYPWVWLPFPILETASLILWGTTPGKWILGMRVCDHKEDKLNVQRALYRSFYVLFFGMGMVTTLFSPIMMLLSWWYTRKSGMSPWDKRLGTIVEIKKNANNEYGISYRRIIIMVILFYMLTEILAIIMEPWIPAIEALSRTGFGG
ncbi:MAG: RDD family protein [Akkermansia sp.]